MLLKVSIKNTLSQVRREPGFSSSVVSILAPAVGVTYSATKMFKGWFYLSDISAWVEVGDITIVEEIEPYDPTEDYGSGTTPVIPTPDDGVLSLDDIVNGINTGNYRINSDKISFTDNGTEYNLITFLKTVNNSLLNMNNAVIKMNTLPAIPALPASELLENGMALIVKDGVLTWSKIDTTELANTVETDTRFKNEF